LTLNWRSIYFAPGRRANRFVLAPAVQLTLRAAAGYLGVSESTVRRWIADRGLPVHEANERLYLNAMELWEWAVEHGVPVSRSLLNRERRSPDPVPPMSALLRAGGVVYDIAATDKRQVLREFVARLPLPPEQDRATLLAVLEAREAMGSTGIGDGIAIPHVRNPIVLHLDHPFVTLALLRHPVEFDAIDGQPVHAMFLVVSPTVPVHLRILAQLGFLLRDEQLRELMRRRVPAEELIGRIEVLEATRTTGSFTVPPPA
jgi:PTS system nitrogen regulatory IIA component